MNGPQHYSAAERLLQGTHLYDDQYDPPTEDEVARAQVHATLALAKATEDFVAAALGDNPPRIVAVTS